MANKDYYSILGLTEEDKQLPQAEFLEKAKKNYRTLCKKYHPDLYATKTEAEQQEAADKFKEIAEAYDVLSNTEKKERYDKFGTADEFDFGNFRPSGMPDVDEIMRKFRSGFGRFDGFQSQTQGPRPLKIKITATLEEVYYGAKKKIRYKRIIPCETCNGKGYGENGKIEKCPYCGGTGQSIRVKHNAFMNMQEISMCPHCGGQGVFIQNPCDTCHGSGFQPKTEETEIELQKGCTDGAVFIVPGKGNIDNDGKSGDIYIMVSVVPDNRFFIVNDSYDLYTEMEVPILDCLTGCKRELPLFRNEKIMIKIPKLTKPDSLLRVAGKGLQKQDGGRGSLIVKTVYKFPNNISNDELKAIEGLKNSKNFKQ